MKHLIDERYAITTDDIDRAQIEARDFLDGCDDTFNDPIAYLVQRLLAIVENTYGEPS